MKIGIIGGSDGLGKTIAYYLKDEFEVTITGRDPKKGQNVAKDIGVKYCKDNNNLASESDILIISVPINLTNEVIKEVASSMKPGSLMVDVTSVKEGPSQCMSESLNEDIEFIPTHPIFGPRTTDLDNQVIVLTPIRKGKWYSKVYNYLDRKNMRILETTASKHDYMMSIVQVLTHFSYISTASAIEKLKVNIKDTEDFESPIYNLMIDMIARIVSQNPYLTYYIQSSNKNGAKIRNTFAEAVLELKDTINNEDERSFVEIANKATKNMGDIQGALGRSDKAINSLNHEVNILYQSLGKEIGVKHIYSGIIHTGILKEINQGTIILQNKKKTKQIKIANIKLLTDEELYEWKVKSEKHEIHTISCAFPKNIDKEVIKDTIYRLDNIIEVKIIDVYQGPQIQEDHLSLTFEVTGLYKKSIKNVKKLLTGFGGKIR